MEAAKNMDSYSYTFDVITTNDGVYYANSFKWKH